MRSAPTHAQGWYVDPYGRHHARWFSDGAPTALVRDDGRDATDPPPATPYLGPLEPAAETEGELLHSHLGDRSGDGTSPTNAIWEIFVATGGD